MSGEKLQFTRAEVAGMSAEQIAEALKEGRLADLLAGNDPGRSQEEFVPPADAADQGPRGKTFRSSRDWLRSLSADQVNALRREGHLDWLLRGEDGTQ